MGLQNTNPRWLRWYSTELWDLYWKSCPSTWAYWCKNEFSQECCACRNQYHCYFSSAACIVTTGNSILWNCMFKRLTRKLHDIRFDLRTCTIGMDHFEICCKQLILEIFIYMTISGPPQWLHWSTSFYTSREYSCHTGGSWSPCFSGSPLSDQRQVKK